MSRLAIALTASAAVVAFAGAAAARDQIVSSGSVTAAPYVQAVATEFAKAGHPEPEYRPIEVGGDLQGLCGGIGAEFPDIAVTGVPAADATAAECRENGVGTLAEIRIGMDAMVVVSEGELVNEIRGLTARHIWLATSAKVPVNGVLAANPYKLWSEIDPSLPAERIEVLMPPDESGLEEVFDAMIQPVCESEPLIRALDEEQQEEICEEHREDGAIVPVADVAEVPDLLDELDHAMAITSHQAFVAGSGDDDDEDDAMFPIDGVAPSPETIADGSYKGAHPVLLYVKSEHLGMVAGLRDFAIEFTSEKAIGEDGYLVSLGLVPLSAEDRDAARAAAAALATTN